MKKIRGALAAKLNPLFNYEGRSRIQSSKKELLPRNLDAIVGASYYTSYFCSSLLPPSVEHMSTWKGRRAEHFVAQCSSFQPCRSFITWFPWKRVSFTEPSNSSELASWLWRYKTWSVKSFPPLNCVLAGLIRKWWVAPLSSNPASTEGPWTHLAITACHNNDDRMSSSARITNVAQEEWHLLSLSLAFNDNSYRDHTQWDPCAISFHSQWYT